MGWSMMSRSRSGGPTMSQIFLFHRATLELGGQIPSVPGRSWPPGSRRWCRGPGDGRCPAGRPADGTQLVEVMASALASVPDQWPRAGCTTMPGGLLTATASRLRRGSPAGCLRAWRLPRHLRHHDHHPLAEPQPIRGLGCRPSTVTPAGGDRAAQLDAAVAGKRSARKASSRWPTPASSTINSTGASEQFVRNQIVRNHEHGFGCSAGGAGSLGFGAAPPASLRRAAAFPLSVRPPSAPVLPVRFGRGLGFGFWRRVWPQLRRLAWAGSVAGLGSGAGAGFDSCAGSGLAAASGAGLSSGCGAVLASGFATGSLDSAVAEAFDSSAGA